LERLDISGSNGAQWKANEEKESPMLCRKRDAKNEPQLTAALAKGRKVL